MSDLSFFDKDIFPCRHASKESCVLLDCIDSMDTGLMIGRPSTGIYIYANQYARHVLETSADALSLKKLLSRSRKPAIGGEVGSDSSDDRAMRKIIRIRGKVVGLTIYQSSDDLAVITLKDISQENYFSKDMTNGSPGLDTIIRLFAQLRHEIGNPLNSIKVTLQVLKENLDTFEPVKVHAYIARTIEEVKRLENLLVSMREFSRYDTIDIKEADLMAVLARFCNLVEEECRSAGVGLELQLAKEARFVKADTKVLIQVLHNLLRNAIEAISGDSGRVVIRTKSGSSPEMVKIEFEDNGRGIPRSKLPMVFKPMFTTKANGTGLGLAMVERLVFRMEGSISVSSEEGSYTRFDLMLRSGSST